VAYTPAAVDVAPVVDAVSLDLALAINDMFAAAIVDGVTLLQKDVLQPAPVDVAPVVDAVFFTQVSVLAAASLDVAVTVDQAVFTEVSPRAPYSLPLTSEVAGPGQAAAGITLTTVRTSTIRRQV
jgi:hypothetical protein